MFRYLGVNQVRNIDSLYSGENIEINRNLNSEKKEDGGSENQGSVKSTEEGKESKSNETCTLDQRRSHSSEKRSSHSDRYNHKRDDHHKASSSSSSHHHHYHHKSSSSRQQQAHRYQRQLQLDKFNRFRRSVSVEPSAYRSQHRSFIQKPPPGSGPGYGRSKEWGGGASQGQRKKREREGGWGQHIRGGRGKRGGYQGRRGNRRRQNLRNMMSHDDAMDLEMPPPPNQHFRRNMRGNKGFTKSNFNPRPPLLPLPVPALSSPSMLMLPPPPPPPLFDMPPPSLVPSSQQRDTSPVTSLPGSSSSEAIQKEKFEHNRMLAEKRDEHSMKEKSLMQDLHLLQSQRAKLIKQHDPHNNKIVKENEKLQDEIRKKIEATRSAIQMLTDIIGDHMKHSTPQISRRAPPSPVHESEDSSDSRESDDDADSQSSSQSQSEESGSSQESTDAETHASAASQGVFKTPANPGRGRRYKISRNRNIFVRRRDITTRDRRKIDTTSFIQTAGQAVLKSQQQETLQEKSQKMEMKLHHCEDTDNEDIFPLVSSVSGTGELSSAASRTMEEDIEDIFNLRRAPSGQRYDEQGSPVDEGEEKGEAREEAASQTAPRRKSPTTIIEEIILDGNEDLSGVLTKPADRDTSGRRTNIQITLKKRDKRNRCEERATADEKKPVTSPEGVASSDRLEVFWCQPCNVESSSAVAHLNHLQSTTHAHNAKPEQPWLSHEPNIPRPPSPLPQHRHRICSGSQMLIPVTAWYCKLCHECFVDIRAAASHLQCPLHWTKLESYTNENPLWEITLLRARSEAAGLKPVSKDEDSASINSDKDIIHSATVKPVHEEENAEEEGTQHNSPSKSESNKCEKESENPEESKPMRTSLSEMFAEETNEDNDKNKLWVPNRKAFDEISRQQQVTESSSNGGKKKPAFIGKMPTGKGKIKIKVGKSSSENAGAKKVVADGVPPRIDTNLVASVGNILSQLSSIYKVEQETEEAERERDILYAEREMAVREAREMLERGRKSASCSPHGSSDSSRENSVQRPSRDSSEARSENSDGICSERDASRRTSRSRSSSRSSTGSSRSQTISRSPSKSSRDNSSSCHEGSLPFRPAEYVDFEFDFNSSQESHPVEQRREARTASSSREAVSSDDELDVDDTLVDDSDPEEARGMDVDVSQNFSTVSKASSRESVRASSNQNVSTASNVSSRLDIDFFSRSHDEKRDNDGQKFTNVSGYFASNQHRNHIDTFLENSARLSHDEDESGLSERVEGIMKRRQDRGLSETSSSREEIVNDEAVRRDVSVEYMSGSDSTRAHSDNEHGEDSSPKSGETLSKEKTEEVEEAEKIKNPIGFQGAIFFNREREQRQIQVPFLSEDTPQEAGGDIFRDCQQLKSKLDRVKDRIRADGKKYSSFQDAFRDHRERCAIQLRREMNEGKQEDESLVKDMGGKDACQKEGALQEENDLEVQEDVYEDMPSEEDERGFQDEVEMSEGIVDVFHHRDMETPVGAIFTRNRSKRASLSEHHQGSDEESCQSFDTGSTKRKRVNKYLEEEEKLKSLEEEEEKMRLMEEERLRMLEDEEERKQLEEAEERLRIAKEERIKRMKLRVLEEERLQEEKRLRRLAEEKERLKTKEEETRRLKEELLKRRRLEEEESRQRLEEEVTDTMRESCTRQNQLLSEPVAPKRPRRLGNLTSFINRFRFETKISEVDCSEEIDDAIEDIYKAKRYPPVVENSASYPTRSEFVNFALKASPSQPPVRRVNIPMRDVHPDSHFKPIMQMGMKPLLGSALKGLDEPLRELTLYPNPYSHYDGLVSPLERSVSELSPEQELTQNYQPESASPAFLSRNPAVVQSNSVASQGKTINSVKKRKNKIASQPLKRQKSEKDNDRPWSRQSVGSEFSVAEEMERVRSLHSRLSGQVEPRDAFSSNSFRTSTPSSTLSSPSRQKRAKPSVFEPIEEQLENHQSLEDNRWRSKDESAARCRDLSITRLRLDRISQQVNAAKVSLQSRLHKENESQERLARDRLLAAKSGLAAGGVIGRSFESDRLSGHTDSIFDSLESRRDPKPRPLDQYFEDELAGPSQSEDPNENPPIAVRKQCPRVDIDAGEFTPVDVLSRDRSDSQVPRKSRKDSVSSGAFQSDAETAQLNIHRDTFQSREIDDAAIKQRDLIFSGLHRSMPQSRLNKPYSRETSLARSGESRKSTLVKVPSQVSLASEHAGPELERGEFSKPLQPRERSRPRSISTSRSRLEKESSGRSSTLDPNREKQTNLARFSSQSSLSEASDESILKKAPKNQSKTVRSPRLLSLPEGTSHSHLPRTQSQSSLLSTDNDEVRFSSPKVPRKISQSRLSRKDHLLATSLKGEKTELQRNLRLPIPSKDIPEDFQSTDPKDNLCHSAHQRSPDRRTTNVTGMATPLRGTRGVSRSRVIRDMSEDRASNISSVSMEMTRRESSADICNDRASSLSVSSIDRHVRGTLVEKNHAMREPSVDRRSNASSKTRSSQAREPSVSRGSSLGTPTIDRSPKQSRDTKAAFVDRIESSSKKTSQVKSGSQQIPGNRESSVQRSLRSPQLSPLPSPKRQISDTKPQKVPSRQANSSASSQNIPNPLNSGLSPSKVGGSDYQCDKNKGLDKTERGPVQPQPDNKTKTDKIRASSSIKSVERSNEVKSHLNKTSHQGDSMGKTDANDGVSKQDVRNQDGSRHKDRSVDALEQQKQKAAFIENERKRLYARMQELEQQIQSAKQGAHKQLGNQPGQENVGDRDVQGQKRDERNQKYVKRSSASVSNVKNQPIPSQGNPSNAPLTTSRAGLSLKSRNETHTVQEMQKQRESKDMKDGKVRQENRDKETSGNGSSTLSQKDGKHLKEMSVDGTGKHQDSSIDESDTHRKTCGKLGDEGSGEAVSDQQLIQTCALKTEVKQETPSLLQTAEPNEAYTSAPHVKLEEPDDEHSSGSRENYPGPVHISQYVSSQVVKQEQQAGSTSDGQDGTPPLFIPGIFINSNEQFVVKSSTIYKKRTMSKKKRIKEKKKRMAMENQQEKGSTSQTQSPGVQ